MSLERGEMMGNRILNQIVANAATCADKLVAAGYGQSGHSRTLLGMVEEACELRKDNERMKVEIDRLTNEVVCLHEDCAFYQEAVKAGLVAELAGSKGGK